MHLSKKKIDTVFIHGVALAPWIFAITILIFYFHTTILLGRSPTYANPDPKDLFIYNFYGWIINPFLIITFITFFIWPIIFIMHVSTSSLYKWKKPLLLHISGHALAFIIFLSPIFDWYID